MNNYEVKQLLRSAVQKNKVLHSYMFIGSKLTQKEEEAMRFTKNILCLSDDTRPCEECKSCVEIKNGNHPDFIKIRLEDDINSIKIEQIRKLQEDIIKKPIVSEKKVYIIKDSDKMTVGAQNCLLKTLEEPPEYAIIILLVENENVILNTIKSRCTKIIFTEETEKEMTEEQRKIYSELEKIFCNIDNYTLLDVLNKVDILYKGEKSIFEILEYINVILYKNITNDKRNVEYITYVEETKKRIQSNANYNMCIDNLLISIWKK